jgi:23S rRNA pseudouridine955/2504/2580 synthase
MPVRKTLIPPDAEGMKTGLFLRRLLPSLPESVLRKFSAAREVKLDGVRADRDTPVHAGQTLSVFLPASHEESPVLRVVYEDEDVLLVNKPAGVSVESDEPGSLSLTDLCRLHTQSRPTLSTAAHSFEPPAAGDPTHLSPNTPPAAGEPDAAFPQAVHRLDNKTCGLCLFAKNPRAHAVLLEAFKHRTVEKYYICLVRGIPKPPAATCSAFLLKDAARGVVQILDQNRPGARPITTGYETLSAGPVSRLRVHLITGRTHQIRAHLAALGHPVLGDDLYGDRSFNRLQKSRSLKLCAAELTLHTEGQLPNLDGKTFKINPPF